MKRIVVVGDMAVTIGELRRRERLARRVKNPIKLPQVYATARTLFGPDPKPEPQQRTELHRPRTVGKFDAAYLAEVKAEKGLGSDSRERRRQRRIANKRNRRRDG